jgi:NAD(P)-dependent dehydrogenase (short-subunit alcohol dehydrogenase family)
MSRAPTRRVLITGGASGLGRALAEACARRGDRLLLTDLSAERLAETAVALRALGAGDVLTEVADVRSDADWSRLVARVEGAWTGLDLLVNNAGVAVAGRIETAPQEDWDWVLSINLLGVVRGCRAFTPLFKAQRSGAFLNIASLAAIAAAPTMAAYNVTKAGVVSLSETLHHELSPYGITVTVGCPSFFATNLGETLRASDAGLGASAKKMIARGSLTADAVAATLLADLDAGRLLSLPHREGRLLWRVKRWLPWLFHRVMIREGRKLMAKLDPSLDGPR